MRINNPKSLVNFTRGAGQTPDSSAYNLATIGQLKRAINNLDSKYAGILAGGENFGSTGLTKTHGYAWLNPEGKVDTSLLPALAITDTHVIYQSELKALKNSNEITEKEDLSYLLDIYVKNKIDTENARYQKGDIIIVKPTEVAGSEDKEIPDPVYSGSYIIADTPSESDPKGTPFVFAKIAYTDSNIVKINGKVPSNSIGEVHLYLKDILQEAYLYDLSITSGVTVDVKEAELKAKELSDSVYRLVTIDEGANGFRFGFIDNSSVDGGLIPYAKLKELQDLDARETSDYNELTDAIANLDHKLMTTSGLLHIESVTASGNLHNEIITTSSYLYDELDSVSSFLYTELDTTSGFLYSELNTTSGFLYSELNTTSSLISSDIVYISSTIGDRTVNPNRNLSATIFEQTKALRKDVDNNLDLLNQTRQDTNEYLELIQTNVKNLHTKLNEKAVKIIEKEIEWTKECLLDGKPTLHQLSASEKLEYQISSPDVIGILTWTYKYEPTELNDPAAADPTDNSATSEERVLAVFDQDGNEIMVDMHRKKLSNGLMGTYLSIDTEYLGGNDEVGYTNSLIGTKWTLLIAKTITNIAINDATFKVGGNKFTVPPTNTWTDAPVESDTPDLPETTTV